MAGRWLTSVVDAIRAAAEDGRILFTYKALVEMAELGCDREDVRDILASLDAREFFRRVRSERTGEWLYEFKPMLGDDTIYLKVALRQGCLLISFHEDRDEEAEDR